MSEHTPTPWREWDVMAQDGKDEYPMPMTGDLRLCGANNICIGVVFGGYVSLPECNRNAAFIVKAVNSHDALVDALKFALEVMESYAFSSGNDPRTATPESAIGRCRSILAVVSSPPVRERP